MRMEYVLIASMFCIRDQIWILFLSQPDDRKAREHVDRIFAKFDTNEDGIVTIEEFLDFCLKVSTKN